MGRNTRGMDRRAARFLSTVAILASAIALGCSSDESAPPPVDELLAPPPAGEGVQYRMLTEVAAASEVEHCQFFQAPPEGLNVVRSERTYGR